MPGIFVTDGVNIAMTQCINVGVGRLSWLIMQSYTICAWALQQYDQYSKGRFVHIWGAMYQIQMYMYIYGLHGEHTAIT